MKKIIIRKKQVNEKLQKEEETEGIKHCEEIEEIARMGI